MGESGKIFLIIPQKITTKHQVVLKSMYITEELPLMYPAFSWSPNVWFGNGFMNLNNRLVFDLIANNCNLWLARRLYWWILHKYNFSFAQKASRWISCRLSFSPRNPIGFYAQSRNVPKSTKCKWTNHSWATRFMVHKGVSLSTSRL